MRRALSSGRKLPAHPGRKRPTATAASCSSGRLLRCGSKLRTPAPSPSATDRPRRPAGTTATHLDQLLGVVTDDGRHVGVVPRQPVAQLVLGVVAALHQPVDDLGRRRLVGQVVDVAGLRVQAPADHARDQILVRNLAVTAGSVTGVRFCIARWGRSRGETGSQARALILWRQGWPCGQLDEESQSLAGGRLRQTAAPTSSRNRLPTCRALPVESASESLACCSEERGVGACVDEDEDVRVDAGRLDGLRLLGAARVAVQQPALPLRVRLRESRDHHVDNNLVRHQAALVHEALGRQAGGRAGRDFRTQQVARRDVYQAVLQRRGKGVLRASPFEARSCVCVF